MQIPPPMDKMSIQELAEVAMNILIPPDDDTGPSFADEVREAAIEIINYKVQAITGKPFDYRKVEGEWVLAVGFSITMLGGFEPTEEQSERLNEALRFLCEQMDLSADAVTDGVTKGVEPGIALRRPPPLTLWPVDVELAMMVDSDRGIEL